jgi:hypothetical protein
MATAHPAMDSQDGWEPVINYDLPIPPDLNVSTMPEWLASFRFAWDAPQEWTIPWANDPYVMFCERARQRGLSIEEIKQLLAEGAPTGNNRLRPLRDPRQIALVMEHWLRTSKTAAQVIPGPIPFIYDIKHDRIYVGHPGEHTDDMAGDFDPLGIVYGEYRPNGEVEIQTETNMPYTVRHLIQLWYYMHRELPVKNVWLNTGQGRQKLAGTIHQEFAKWVIGTPGEELLTDELLKQTNTPYHEHLFQGLAQHLQIMTEYVISSSSGLRYQLKREWDELATINGYLHQYNVPIDEETGYGQPFSPSVDPHLAELETTLISVWNSHLDPLDPRVGEAELRQDTTRCIDEISRALSAAVQGLRSFHIECT